MPQTLTQMLLLSNTIFIHEETEGQVFRPPQVCSKATAN